MKKENKTKFIILRVTPEERINFLANARHTGVSLSKYIRRLLGLEK